MTHSSGGERAADLQPQDILVLRRRRILSRSERNEDGDELLRVFYGNKDIAFDLPETVAFGRRLIQQERFRAADAMAWSDGAPLAWDDARELLDVLLIEGVLSREHGPPPPAPPAPFTAGTDPRGPVPEPRWRTVEELCAMVSGHLGQEVAPARLEATLGAGLITMAATDEQGRQVGENSLGSYTPFLADPVPTEWARCRYIGSRFDDPRPMNVSALRQVGEHLEPVLGVLAAIRARLLARAGGGPSDLAFMVMLADVLFTLPAWLLARPGARVRNGQLPAWLAGLQKTAGGFVVTVHHLLFFSPEEAVPERPDAAALFRATEEICLFMSPTGVCAGPPAMVERALRVFTGEEPLDGTSALLEELGDLDRALDYALACARLEMVRLFHRAQTQTVVERLLQGERTAELDALRRFMEVSPIPPEGGARCARACASFLERTLWLGGNGARGAKGWSLNAAALPQEIAATLPEGRDDGPWGPALLELLAIEEREQATIDEMQTNIDEMLGRAAPPRVTRADMKALPRLRGEMLMGDAVARLLDLAVREREGRCVLVDRARDAT